MTRGPTSSGSEYLERQSALAKARGARPRITDVLVIEDNDRDTQSISAKLRKVFGQEVGVRHAQTLNSMLDRVLERKPEIVFLDHLLKPDDTAPKSIKYLRDFGYGGPIVVVSSVMTPHLAADLRRLGAIEALHKDALNGGRIAEVVDLIFGGAAGEGGAGTGHDTPKGKA